MLCPRFFPICLLGAHVSEGALSAGWRPCSAVRTSLSPLLGTFSHVRHPSPHTQRRSGKSSENGTDRDFSLGLLLRGHAEWDQRPV